VTLYLSYVFTVYGFSNYLINFTNCKSQIINQISHIKRCFELAQRAKGNTAPNPLVGAVLVCNEQIIGEGWHQHYGSAHAEVNCLASVKEADKHLICESTMYVNLEPCAHYGMTPPCANRLVQEKVKKVVIANTDPFEKVNGNGIQILNAAGIEVETGVLEKEGLWLNRRFFCFHEQKRPYIILKWAQTKEGYFAPADRGRFWITNKHSQQMVHKWRTEEGAILVGTNTAINDNPHLTARLWTGKQPLRIAIDRKLKIPTTHNLFNSEAATWIINEEKELLDGNVHFMKCGFNDTLLKEVLNQLYNARILSLIVEGGAALLQSFIQQGLWDEARVFTGSNTLVGGILAPTLDNAMPAFQTQIDNDMLNVYVNKGSGYPYMPGMEL